MKNLTRQQLAELFGVSRRQVNIWLRQGCPCSFDREEGDFLLDADVVARWRTERAHAALGPRAAARGPFPAMADGIRSAASFARLVELGKEVAIGLCLRTVSLAQAAALQPLMIEARLRLLRDRDHDGGPAGVEEAS